MRHYKFLFILMFFCTLMNSYSMAAQSWDFINEKDGIKIYTRKEAGKSLKSYKGITDINAPAGKIFALMEDVNNTDWWDKNLTHIKVLLYEKNKRAQCYMVYKLPCLVPDRDLCVEVTNAIDPVTGECKMTVVSLPGVIPENKNMVRINNYLQTWTITPTGKEMTHVVLEGFVDPAGHIPDWITNTLIINSPLKAIRELRSRMIKH